jgi:tRNA-intron endonuclease
MQKITIYLEGKSLFSNKNEAIELCKQSNFGEDKTGKVVYSIFEVLYLLEKERAELIDERNKKIAFKELIKKIKDNSPYLVYKDLRDKGRIVKEGLKFGTDFRVYEKGQKPGKNHAPYLLHVVNSNQIKTKDFCAKSRVAHSTAKKLLLAIIDSQEDISYYEVNWKNIL